MVPAGGLAVVAGPRAPLQRHWGGAVSEQPPGALRALYNAQDRGGVLLQVVGLNGFTPMNIDWANETKT